jgi:hypothetical protein
MNITLLILLFIILLILNFYLLNKNILTKDSFISKNNDPINDGKMSFSFLHDPNYTNNILNKYYLNDDTKTNNSRNIFHPYQVKKIQYYGNPKFVSKDIRQSNNYYNTYGIRV